MFYQDTIADKKPALTKFSKSEIEALLLLLSALVISSSIQGELNSKEEQELIGFIESLYSNKNRFPQKEALRLLRKTIDLLDLKQNQGSLEGIAHQKFIQAITGQFYEIYKLE